MITSNANANANQSPAPCRDDSQAPSKEKNALRLGWRFLLEHHGVAINLIFPFALLALMPTLDSRIHQSFMEDAYDPLIGILLIVVAVLGIVGTWIKMNQVYYQHELGQTILPKLPWVLTGLAFMRSLTIAILVMTGFQMFIPHWGIFEDPHLPMALTLFFFFMADIVNMFKWTTYDQENPVIKSSLRANLSVKWQILSEVMVLLLNVFGVITVWSSLTQKLPSVIADSPSLALIMFYNFLHCIFLFLPWRWPYFIEEWYSRDRKTLIAVIVSMLFAASIPVVQISLNHYQQVQQMTPSGLELE